MERIKTIDGTTEVQAVEMPRLAEELEIGDFIRSADLDEVETGIRSLSRAAGSLVLVEGLAILRAEELWEQSGLSSLQEYRKQQNKRLDMTRAAISQRRAIAHAWIDNTKYLRNMDLSNKSRHLLFLDRAIKRHGRKEAISRMVDMSAREYGLWATGAEDEEPLPLIAFRVRGDDVLIDNAPALSFRELEPRKRELIADVLKAAARAWAGQCIPHVVPVYDEGEARAVDNFLKKYRASK